MKKKILFILKHRTNYGFPTGYSLSSGLLNSATYVKDMLQRHHFETSLVQVEDSNSIDREVHKFKPDVVFIEALWVPPTKFKELQRLHPRVKWVVRIHSNVPFLGNEGMAFRWIKEYQDYKNVIVAFNSFEAFKNFHWHWDNTKTLAYLPNYYPTNMHQHTHRSKDGVLDVGCFGAIRQLKNQLNQAMAAIFYCQEKGLTLRFHINAGRIDNEQDAPILKNLRSLFAGFDKRQFTLVEHDWLNKSEFLDLVKTMDLGLQVSFSETFNIVTADFVSHMVPIVVSQEIGWMPNSTHAMPTSIDNIIQHIDEVLHNPHITKESYQALFNYSEFSEIEWISFLKHHG